MNLFTHAFEVVNNTSNPPGLREVAGACVVAGLEEGFGVPAGTPIAIWKWVRDTTPKRWYAARSRLREVHDREVFEAALAALRDPASGTEVLSGSAYAPLIPDEVIVDLLERPHLEPGRLLA